MKTKNSWSFEGQDRILNVIFRMKKKGFFVEVGCNHPVKNNNTYLLYKKGWKGVGIDGYKKFKNSWFKYRPKDKFICSVISDKNKTKQFTHFKDPTNASLDKSTIKRYIKRLGKPIKKQTVKTYTLESILKKNKVKRDFDLLAIDAEGHDYEVLKGLNFKYFKPKVILIEIRFFNFLNPLKNRIVNLLYNNRYLLISKTPYDAIFVKKNEKLGWIPKKLL